MRLDAGKEPIVRMVNDVLFSLLAGDLRQLETLFDIDGSIEGDHWNVTLKAREPGLAKSYRRNQLSGGRVCAAGHHQRSQRRPHDHRVFGR